MPQRPHWRAEKNQASPHHQRRTHIETRIFEQPGRKVLQARLPDDLPDDLIATPISSC